MYIHEAVRLASGKNVGIKRHSDHYYYSNGVIFIPTNTKDCVICSTKEKRLYPRWNPTADELMADDWEVAD